MSAKRTKQGRLTVPGLERHGEKYRWRPMVAGKRHTFVLAARTEDEAIREVLQLRADPRIYDLGAWAHEVEAYLADGLARKKLSEASVAVRRTTLMQMKGKMGVESPRAVTPLMAEDWLAVVVAEHPGKSTAASYLTHAKGLFRFLKDQGRIPFNPFDRLRLGVEDEDEGLRDVFLPAAQVVELLEAAKAKGDRDLEWILLLGFECGMRRGEISAARPLWFNLETGTVTIPAADGKFKRKGREGRRKPATIALSEPVLDMIRRHGLTEPYLVAPEKEYGKWRYRFEFRKKLGAFFGKHGHEGVTIHDMRRSFASNRVSAGVSIEKVANWMGIDQKTAWKRYSRFIPGDADINRGAAVRPVEKAKEEEAPKGGVAERLRVLKGLLADELVTPEEFAAKRDAILGEL